MPLAIFQGGQKQIQKHIPDAQLQREQRDKFSQWRPIVWRRNVDKSKGVNVSVRK